MHPHSQILRGSVQTKEALGLAGHEIRGISLRNEMLGIIAMSERV